MSSTSRRAARAAITTALAFALVGVAAPAAGAASAATPSAADPVAASSPSLSASPSPSVAQSRASSSIVGTWNGTVYRADGVVEPGARLIFAADGGVVQYGTQGAGTGTWTRTSPYTFHYRTRTETGFGYLEVEQDVFIGGDHFYSRGRGTGYDRSGNVLLTAESRIEATRER